MLRTILCGVLLSAHLVNSQLTTAETIPFVDGAVTCNSQTVNFAINPNNEGFKTLSSYTTFVGVFVDHANPNCSSTPISSVNPLTPDYNLAISFSNCNVTIDALYGAQHKLLEYSATVYTRLSPVDFVAGSLQINASYPNITFPITCNWLTGAQVTNNQTVDNKDPQPPPPIGNTTSPVDQLNMTLTDGNGNPLTEVEAGTRVRVVLLLDGDSFYKSELPEYCSISNARNPLFGTFIAVIANYCPYNDTIINSPFNFMAAQQDNNTYYFEFDAFTFNNVKTTLYITCYIQVCLDYADCHRSCWDPSKPMSARDLEEKFSHYRQIPIQFDDANLPHIVNTSRSGNFDVVLKDSVTPTGTTSSGSGLPDWALILIIFFTGFLLFSLLICFCCCVCCGVGLGLWKRRGEKKHHHRTEYIYPQAAPPTYVADNSSIYHMEIPKVNLSSSSARSVTSDKSYKY